MIYNIDQNEDTPVRELLSSISIQDNNLTLSLSNENITIETAGEWTGEMTDLIQLLHDLVEMKEKQNGKL